MFDTAAFPIYLKDLVHVKRQLIIYSVLSFLSIAFMAIPKPYFGHIGSIFLVTVVIAFYCHMIMKLVISERKDQNHLFIMSLPVSAKTALICKSLACMTAFLIVWVPVSAATLCMVSLLPGWPAVGPAFYGVIFAVCVVGFLCVLTVAILKGTEGWTIFSLVASNVSVTVTINTFPNLPSMKAGFGAGTIGELGILWPPVSTMAILIALTVSAVLLLAMFVGVQRRQAFV